MCDIVRKALRKKYEKDDVSIRESLKNVSKRELESRRPHVTRAGLKKKLLLDKDNQGYRAWDRAAQFGSLEALETLKSWKKEAELYRDQL